MSTGTRIGLIIISLSLFLSFSTPLYAADSVLTHPPVVTSITGSTSGYVGTSYSFTGVITSTSEYALSQVTLYATGSSLVTKNAGDSLCTTTSCTLTGTFTPATEGTFNIYLRATYSDGGSSYQCDSLPNDLTNDCQSSTTKYIAFVVLAAPTTPVVTSITGPTSGVIGSSYTFSTTVTSIESVPIDSIYIFVDKSTDPSTVHPVSESVSAPSTGCTSTSCSVSVTFSPTRVGTYQAYVAASTEGVSSGCYTSEHAGLLCSYSAGKYINFIVTDGTTTTNDSLPSTGLLSNQTKGIYIGLCFIALGILTTQTHRITNAIDFLSERKITKKKSKLENRFK